MTVFVFDNSVTILSCFQNAAHPYADGVLQQLATGVAFVPVLWRYEVSAVLAKSEKDGILTALKKLKKNTLHLTGQARDFAIHPLLTALMLLAGAPGCSTQTHLEQDFSR